MPPPHGHPAGEGRKSADPNPPATPLGQQRRAQCERAAKAYDHVSATELHEMAFAAWSNLNPQSISWDRALSVASACALALDRVRKAERSL